MKPWVEKLLAIALGVLLMAIVMILIGTMLLLYPIDH